jgi:hypothetical protein
LVEAEDLASRAFILNLPPLIERVSEIELERRCNAARPRILAGVLDGVCHTLRNVGGVRLPETPRIVGPVEWAVAAAPNFGFDDGEIFQACQDNSRELLQSAYEADVVAQVLVSFVNSLAGQQWEGTSEALYAAFANHAIDRTTEIQRRSVRWPHSAKGLTNRLKDSESTLRSQGIHMEYNKTRGARLYTIVKIDRPRSGLAVLL